MAQVRFNPTKRILQQATRQAMKKSGNARMKSILSVTAPPAMDLMTGSEPTACSKKSTAKATMGVRNANELAILFNPAQPPGLGQARAAVAHSHEESSWGQALREIAC